MEYPGRGSIRIEKAIAMTWKKTGRVIRRFCKRIFTSSAPPLRFTSSLALFCQVNGRLWKPGGCPPLSIFCPLRIVAADSAETEYFEISDSPGGIRHGKAGGHSMEKGEDLKTNRTGTPP
jgi:hypothetical protein